MITSHLDLKSSLDNRMVPSNLDQTATAVIISEFGGSISFMFFTGIDIEI